MGVLAAVATAGVVMQYQQGEQAAGAQRDAAAQATKNATAQADAADQANNAANAKQPNVTSIASRNALDAKGGVGSTMLTGPQGVDPKSLMLGKSTLLGG